MVYATGRKVTIVVVVGRRSPIVTLNTSTTSQSTKRESLNFKCFVPLQRASLVVPRGKRGEPVVLLLMYRIHH
jgi:hypothetical protein